MSTKYLSSLNPLNQELDLRTYDFTIDGRLFQAVSTVVQATSVTTAVTCNAVSGKVVTFAATTAADANFSFVINNNLVNADDVIQLTIQNYSGTGMPYAIARSPTDGVINVTVTNVGTAALNNSLTIGFTVHSAIQ